jgi:NADH:ubiquinone oxidoreductase subunit 2 (subunit N)
MAGGSPEADPASRQLEVVFVAVVCAAATIGFGILPEPLFDAAQAAAQSLGVF